MIAEQRVYLALESSGTISNPPDWLEEGLIIDQFGQRFGWNFLSEGLGMKELTIEQFAVLQGIINGELKKQRMDKCIICQ